MRKLTKIIFYVVVLTLLLPVSSLWANDKVRIKAIGIPLADHYPAIVAFEKYRKEMEFADFQLLLLPGPDFVRAYFTSEPDADIAFNVCPMVLDMFAQKPNFSWVSLIHRDGNALAVNNLLNEKINLPQDKRARKPDNKVALAFKEFKAEQGKPVKCAIPSPLSTHTTVLYKYLKDNNGTLGFRQHEDVNVVLQVVAPPKSPTYLKTKTARKQPAAFEQSLPWPEVADSGGFGHIAWYSKDVMNHPHGHVECIIIAKNEVIDKKREALREVIYFIHKAGQDIEVARKKGGEELMQIIAMIQKHIPQHTDTAIIESLRPDLAVINYNNLNVDDEAKDSLRKIMDLAFEAGFLKNKIDIEALADESFSTKITVRP